MSPGMDTSRSRHGDLPLVEPRDIPDIGEALQVVADHPKDMLPSDLGRSASAHTPVLLNLLDLSRSCPRLGDLVHQLPSSSKFQAFYNLKDQIVVDLGAGRTEIGYVTALAANARAYVGVDRFNASSLRGSIRECMSRLAGTNSLIPATVLDTDARQVLSALPERSVSVMASGLDGELFVDSFHSCVLDELGKGISRVIHPNGVVILVESDIPLRTNGFDLETVSEPDRYPTVLLGRLKA